MAFIQANDGVITQINVFTVAPEKQQELIDLLSEAATFASRLPVGSRPVSIAVWTRRGW